MRFAAQPEACRRGGQGRRCFSLLALLFCLGDVGEASQPASITSLISDTLTLEIGLTKYNSKPKQQQQQATGNKQPQPAPTSNMMTITTTSIRNAIVFGIGSLILAKALTTQSAKIFLLTLACLIAAQAIMMADNDEKNQKDDDDDDDDVAAEEEMDLGVIVENDGGKSKKIEEDNTFKMAKEDIAESYVLVDDKQDKKEKDSNGMILLKDSFADGKTMENGTTGGVADLTSAPGTGIAKKGGGSGGSNGSKSSSKIIADDSPKIVEFVEQYCDDLIDTAVAEVLNEVISRVVDIGGNQEEEEEQK